MKSRVTSLTLPALIVLLLFGGALERISGAADRTQTKPRSNSEAQAARKNAEPQKLVPPGPGKHLAFDVLPRDHRRTIRYVLEITDPSGKVTLHDFKKPRLVKRSTIMVPLPQLAPGEYKLVVIAEGRGGSTRSAPLVYKVAAK